MEHLQENIPPAWALNFFRWFCHPAFREDIEGDLLEQFHHRATLMGIQKAKRLFIKDVFLLFKSGVVRDIIGSYNQNKITMKKIDWLLLAGFNVLVFLLTISPFLPGPSNKIVGVFSFAGQLTGLIGLLLVPLGLVWTLIEIRKQKVDDKKIFNQQAQYRLAIAAISLIALVFLAGALLLPNPMPKLTFVFGLLLVATGFILASNQIKKWKEKNEAIPGHGASILLAVSATACLTFIYIFTVVFLFVSLGIIPGILSLLLLPIFLSLAIKQIRKLKEHSENKFNKLPLYLVTVPISAFITFMFIIKPLSNYSRNYAIQKSETLIAAIETHKNKTGVYPTSLHALYESPAEKMPKPSIMGIENFRYNKIENSYSLSFSQWLELGSLEEIVLFDKSNLRHNLPGIYSKYDYSLDLCRVKGAFAGHDTGYDNWRYYHSD